MKAGRTLMAACAALALGAGGALANCAEELAAFEGGEAGAEGVAKDGTLAPLEEPEIAGDGGEGAAGVGIESAADAEAADAVAEAGGDAEAGSAGGEAGFDAAAGGTGAEAGTAAGEGEVAKDGSLAPLETEAGDMPAGVAMSGQDAEAQQEGEPTVAEAADAGSDATGAGTATADAGADASGRDAALERARAALAQGDEEACMAALEEARSL